MGGRFLRLNGELLVKQTVFLTSFELIQYF